MIHYSMVMALLLGLMFALGSEAMIAPQHKAGYSEQNYSVLREGKPIGHHRVVIQRAEKLVKVSAETEMDVRFLGLSFYRFRYQAEEVWDQEGLRHLRIDIDNDGEQRRIDGKRQGRDFFWRVDGGASRSAPMPVYPTNHWNVEVLEQTRVLNTLTGAMNAISVMPLERLDTPAPSAFRYQGELQLESWYDVDGLWLGMRFQGSDGSTIEYLCRDCPAGTET